MILKRKRVFKNVEGKPSSSSTKGGWGWLIFTFLVLLVLGFTGYRYGLSAFISFTDFLINLNNKEEIKDLSQEKIPPSPPQLDPLPEATNSASLFVSGHAQPGMEIKLFLNDKEIERMVADEEGKFTTDKLSLVSGENVFFARAVDKAGSESQDSLRQTIIFDDQPPSLEVTSPQDKEIFRDEEKKEIVIKGKTDKDALIAINERKVVVKLDGSFEARYSLAEGKNKITIVAQDKAGNKTEKTINVTYYP